MPAVALTDHGSLGGAVQFYTRRRKAGHQAHHRPRAVRGQRPPQRAAGVKERNAHLTLLARDETGYRNLVKLSHARLPRGLLLQAARRLGAARASTTRASSPHRLHERPRRAAAAATATTTAAHAEVQRLADLFGAGERLRRAAGRRPARAARAAAQARAARRAGRPARRWPPTTCTTCATRTPTPTTCCSASRRRATSPTRTACATAATSSTSRRPRRCASASRDYPGRLRRHPGDRRALRRQPRLRRLPAAALTRCPRATPRQRTCASSASRASCAATAPSPAPEVRERLDFELGVIGEMGFDAYFLIVWDFVNFAKDNGIAVGPGRGSAAGLHRQLRARHHRPRPAQVRPALRALPQPGAQEHARHRHRLLGGRAARRSSTTWPQQVRPRPRGPDHHLRHHGGARRHPRRRPGHGRALRRRRPDRQDDPRAGAAGTFEQAMLPGGELKQAYDADEQVKEVVDLAMRLEGLIRNDSIHAAGVVISDKPLTEYLPLQQKGDAEVVTQFDMNDVAKLGLLKMDFLGLRNLDVIEAALEIIEKTARRLHRDRPAAPRRREDLPDAGPRRLHRRVPVREPRHARGAARRRPHAVRGPHRHRGPLPAGADAVHPDLRAQQEGPGLGRLRPRGPAPHPRAHLRRDHLPGAVHGHRPPGRRASPRRRRTTCARPSARRTSS